MVVDKTNLTRFDTASKIFPAASSTPSSSIDDAPIASFPRSTTKSSSIPPSTSLFSSISSPSSTSWITKDILNSFAAGSVAGIVTESVLHPLDTVSLRLKVQDSSRKKYANVSHAWRTILKEEGVRGLFAGLETTLILSPFTSAVYFGAYEGAKIFTTSHVSKEYENVAYFISGAFSELACSVINVPAEVIKCRLQLGANPNNASGGFVHYSKNYRNTMHASISILRKEGLTGLYSGYFPCLTVDMLFSAFSFASYEQLKRSYSTYREKEMKELTTLELVGIGSCAGGIAAGITNPVDVVTVRMMTQGNIGHYRSAFHCFESIMEKEGFRGLWSGTFPRMLSIIPTTGLCFGLYETIKYFLYDGDLPEYDFAD